MNALGDTLIFMCIGVWGEIWALDDGEDKVYYVREYKDDFIYWWAQDSPFRKSVSVAAYFYLEGNRNLYIEEHCIWEEL